jgi:hypothetical protein
MPHLKVRNRIAFLSIAILLFFCSTYFSKSLIDTIYSNYTAMHEDLKRQLFIVPWSLLAQTHTLIKEIDHKTFIYPVYSDDLKKLEKTTITLKGYMLPIMARVKQDSFILSPKASSCPFCMPVGPNELVIVQLEDPIKFTDEVITVSGTLVLLKQDQDIGMGVFYRLIDAKII